MSASIRLELDVRPVHRVAADVLVVPFVAAHGLGHGPLAWADWRLCGLLSEALRRDAEAAERDAADEAVVLAPSGGRLRADWVLAVGLPDGISEEGLRRASERILERVRSLGAARLAIALPAGSDPARVSEALAVGLMAGLARRGGQLEVRLLVAREAGRAAWDGLKRAAAAPLPGVALDLSAAADPRSGRAEAPITAAQRAR